jgi:hypothetical protein
MISLVELGNPLPLTFEARGVVLGRDVLTPQDLPCAREVMCSGEPAFESTLVNRSEDPRLLLI